MSLGKGLRWVGLGLSVDLVGVVIWVSFKMAGRDDILFSVILYQNNLTLSPHGRE